MKKIKSYLKQDKKNKNFKTGVKLLIENDKKIKANLLKFLEKESKAKEPSNVAIQMVDSRLHRLVRIDAQSPKKNKEEKTEEIIKTPKNTDKPETDKPKTNKPKTDNPKTDKPETDKPESKKKTEDKKTNK